MSFGMAFFRLPCWLTLRLHVADLKHVDMSTKGLQKSYYSTQARVVRYYENIRLVYEIESRVRDLRRAATPDKQEEEETPKNNPKKGNFPAAEPQVPKLHLEAGQLMLASCPAVVEQETPQARLNWRTI